MQSSIPKEGALDIDPDFNAMFLQTIIMRNSQVLNYSLVHIWTPSSTFPLVSTTLSSCSSDSDSTVQDIIPPSQQRSQAQRPIRCDNLTHLPAPVARKKHHLPFLSELALSHPRLTSASVTILTHEEVALHLWNSALQRGH